MPLEEHALTSVLSDNRIVTAKKGKAFSTNKGIRYCHKLKKLGGGVNFSYKAGNVDTGAVRRANSGPKDRPKTVSSSTEMEMGTSV